MKCGSRNNGYPLQQQQATSETKKTRHQYFHIQTMSHKLKRKQNHEIKGTISILKTTIILLIQKKAKSFFLSVYNKTTNQSEISNLTKSSKKKKKRDYIFQSIHRKDIRAEHRTGLILLLSFGSKELKKGKHERA